MTQIGAYGGRTIALIALCCGAVLLPFSASMQEVSLEAAIRAELQKDGRAAGIPTAQLDMLVEALATEAERQGVRATDISTWEAVSEETTVAEPACDSFICNVNRAFGWDGNFMLIPILLGILSLILIALFGLLLKHHHQSSVPDRWDIQR